jgi:hypothetical protein
MVTDLSDVLQELGCWGATKCRARLGREVKWDGENAEVIGSDKKK